MLFPNHPRVRYHACSSKQASYFTMKILFTSAILLLLQGCIYQSVDEVDIKLATEKCKNNEGIFSPYFSKRSCSFISHSTTLQYDNCLM